MTTPAPRSAADAHDLAKRDHRFGIERGGRLVDEQERPVERDRRDDRREPALPVGERDELRASTVAQPEDAEQQLGTAREVVPGTPE